MQVCLCQVSGKLAEQSTSLIFFTEGKQLDDVDTSRRNKSPGYYSGLYRRQEATGVLESFLSCGMKPCSW